MSTMGGGLAGPAVASMRSGWEEDGREEKEGFVEGAVMVCWDDSFACSIFGSNKECLRCCECGRKKKKRRVL